MLIDFRNSFTDALRSNSKVKPHLKRIATLPCEILMLAFEYQCSHSSVEKRLRGDGIFHDQYQGVSGPVVRVSDS